MQIKDEALNLKFWLVKLQIWSFTLENSKFEVSKCSSPKKKTSNLTSKLFLFYTMVLIFVIINIKP